MPVSQLKLREVGGKARRREEMCPWVSQSPFVIPEPIPENKPFGYTL